MNKWETNFAKLFINTALLMLLAGILLGCLAAASYIWPGFLKQDLGFISLRPMHVSAVLFWILLGASGCVYFGLNQNLPNSINKHLALTQWALWIIAIMGIFFSYFQGKFGGREYWEFEPIWALPILAAWILFLIQFLVQARKMKNWPVYVWMWMTGILFFVFTFTENYLWLIPGFRKEIIGDLTIQWKANGSMVGSWNQILYGTSIFLMDKISGNNKTSTSKVAFFLYFLGFFNLLFNWGHHIYTLPTQPYIRPISYAVSMTEWVFFAKTIYTWKNQLSEAKKHFSFFPYRFLLATNFWVFLNLIQALFMSIPALNLYTHGTHITVAHAMGTTIGINTMIIFATAFMLYTNPCYNFLQGNKQLNRLFWLLQLGLLVFWVSLLGAGVEKGLWQMAESRGNFGDMMNHLRPWFIGFFIGGILLSIAIIGLALNLIWAYIFCRKYPEKEQELKPIE
ncbi:MAG: cbb3-type cytochrome c oxidase subunit I [Bacteroidia bacterium]|nr:cbb3-type cytochrome c oxidase subunit I [Bacteroidia bacterium]MCF8427946.1 cbb3-type cytochrome c oxidase subunit I [Bacteroidia bacterium]